MSDIESLTVRLEDGEIDESNETSVSPESGILGDLRVIVKNCQKADKAQTDRPTSADIDGGKYNDQNIKQYSDAHNSENVYDQEIVYIDEDEMLCVRGASPVPFVVERLSYSRKSPLKDCDTISFDTTPPKKRRTSGKRRRKRTTPRKVVKEKSVSSDEHTDLRKSNSKERSQSPDESQDKLPQLCKFYLKDCCVKKYNCEYMHSEFPCKFFYMGLKCENETSETGCKLSHGTALSAEMLNTLARHIKTAPIDVLGEEFVNIRSKIHVGKINQMLKDTQDNLRPPINAPRKVSPLQNDSTDFFSTLREKLYFLNEDQLNSLQQLEITKVDDLLNLTLSQLNAIGIHATQIEAIQMSFVAGQDTDMRPTQLEVSINQKLPSFELVCYNDENTCGQNWYEQEEGPLVIDETNDANYDENEDKTPEEDNIIIDVVGDSNSDSDSSIIVEEIDKVEHEVAIMSNTDSTDQSQHFVIEETQEGIQLLPNSMVFPNKSPVTECSIPFTEINQKELEVLSKSEELQIEIECSKSQEESQLNENTKELEVLQNSEELKDDIQCSNKQNDVQQSKEVGALQTSEILKDEVQCSNNQNDFQQSEELDEFQKSEELNNENQFLNNQNDYRSNENTEEPQTSQEQEKIQCPKNQDLAQLDKNSMDETEDLLVKKEMIETQIAIETLNDKEKQSYNHSPTEEITQPDIPQQEEKTTPVPLEKEKSTRPHSPIKWSNENKRMCSPQPKVVVAEIDLTVITPPRRSTESTRPVRFKSEPKREYINPFQRKMSPVMSPVVETKQRYSPVKDKQRPKYVPQPNFKQDHQMQGDNSSEDWDADERSDIQSPPKEIASPDQSEDESTPFVADGTCPELPRRTKNLENYQPALEINAHLTYPPIEYKVYEIYMPEYEINKPTLMEKLLKANSTDPRLKKFIEKEKNHGVFPQAEYSFFPPNISQFDPRLRPGTGTNCQDQYYNVSRLLYSYLQRSQWYQELKSNLKIQINHSVSDLVRALNFFHKDPSPQKIFDLFQIECAGVLLEVMRNVGIFIDVNGNITEEANYKQLCAPLQQQQPPETFPSGSQGPHSKPGLLGFAPPGVQHPHHNNSPLSNENSFARQAFGHDCICPNNNNDFQPIGPSFYVGGRYAMNRNQEPSFDSGFEPPPYQRQPQKRNFKRR